MLPWLYDFCGSPSLFCCCHSLHVMVLFVGSLLYSHIRTTNSNNNNFQNIIIPDALCSCLSLLRLEFPLAGQRQSVFAGRPGHYCLSVALTVCLSVGQFSLSVFLSDHVNLAGKVMILSSGCFRPTAHFT